MGAVQPFSEEHKGLDRYRNVSDEMQLEHFQQASLRQAAVAFFRHSTWQPSLAAMPAFWKIIVVVEAVFNIFGGLFMAIKPLDALKPLVRPSINNECGLFFVFACIELLY